MAGFLDDLAARASAYTTEETTVARACFKALLDGAPATVSTLSSRLDMTAVAVAQILTALERKGALAMEGGRVTVARGLSQPPTAHRLEVAGRHAIYACCAVDAVEL